ncbi:unnamed protein product, partial [Didymodactylos carnosus]
SVRDITILRESGLLEHVNDSVQIIADKGYIGEGYVITPRKKPRGRNLTAEAKDFNRDINSAKAAIENINQQLQDAFNLFDTDKSRTISSTELKQVLVALNFKPTEQLIRKIMKEMDTDGDGVIEFDEFVRVMGGVYERKFSNDEMRRAFQCFDTDHSGFITPNELREVLRKLNHNVTEARISEIMREIDSDLDGKINYEEFCQMMHHV